MRSRPLVPASTPLSRLGPSPAPRPRDLLLALPRRAGRPRASSCAQAGHSVLSGSRRLRSRPNPRAPALFGRCSLAVAPAGPSTVSERPLCTAASIARRGLLRLQSPRHSRRREQMRQSCSGSNPRALCAPAPSLLTCMSSRACGGAGEAGKAGEAILGMGRPTAGRWWAGAGLLPGEELRGPQRPT